MTDDDWMKGRVRFGTPKHFAMIEGLVSEKDAEIERLTATCKNKEKLLQIACDGIDRLRARIDTMIAERDAERKMYNDAIADLRGEIERLRIENAALRRALELKP